MNFSSKENNSHIGSGGQTQGSLAANMLAASQTRILDLVFHRSPFKLSIYSLFNQKKLPYDMTMTEREQARACVRGAFN
jgi:hypothetical protein